jgi:signal transduction histidine kinase
MAGDGLKDISHKFIHDIRTPLSVLQMLSDLFSTTPPGPDDINIMKQEIEKMAGMIAGYSEQLKKFY